MRLVPRSFFARNVLLLMALFACGLAGGTFALREWVQKPRITELAELVNLGDEFPEAVDGHGVGAD